jgi:hypothetical protein
VVSPSGVGLGGHGPVYFGAYRRIGVLPGGALRSSAENLGRPAVALGLAALWWAFDAEMEAPLFLGRPWWQERKGAATGAVLHLFLPGHGGEGGLVACRSAPPLFLKTGAVHGALVTVSLLVWLSRWWQDAQGDGSSVVRFVLWSFSPVTLSRFVPPSRRTQHQ